MIYADATALYAESWSPPTSTNFTHFHSSTDPATDTGSAPRRMMVNTQARRLRRGRPPYSVRWNPPSRQTHSRVGAFLSRKLPDLMEKVQLFVARGIRDADNPNKLRYRWRIDHQIPRFKPFLLVGIDQAPSRKSGLWVCNNLLLFLVPYSPRCEFSLTIGGANRVSALLGLELFLPGLNLPNEPDQDHEWVKRAIKMRLGCVSNKFVLIDDIAHNT